MCVKPSEASSEEQNYLIFSEKQVSNLLIFKQIAIIIYYC